MGCRAHPCRAGGPLRAGGGGGEVRTLAVFGIGEKISVGSQVALWEVCRCCWAAPASGLRSVQPCPFLGGVGLLFCHIMLRCWTPFQPFPPSFPLDSHAPAPPPPQTPPFAPPQPQHPPQHSIQSSKSHGSSRYGSAGTVCRGREESGGGGRVFGRRCGLHCCGFSDFWQYTTVM